MKDDDESFEENSEQKLKSDNNRNISMFIS